MEDARRYPAWHGHRARYHQLADVRLELMPASPAFDGLGERVRALGPKWGRNQDAQFNSEEGEAWAKIEHEIEGLAARYGIGVSRILGLLNETVPSERQPIGGDVSNDIWGPRVRLATFPPLGNGVFERLVELGSNRRMPIEIHGDGPSPSSTPVHGLGRFRVALTVPIGFGPDLIIATCSAARRDLPEGDAAFQAKRL